MPSVPEFLNIELIKSAIKSYKKDENVEILNFEISSGFSEHFGSSMFKGKIEFKSPKYSSKAETLSTVIKVKPTVDPNTNFQFDTTPLFKTEIKMYQKVLPLFHELYERNGQSSLKFAPELIYATNEPNMIIILKDLTPDGYACFREPPKEIDDSKLFVKRLAQFHAASIYLQENNQFDFSSFNDTIYDTEEVLDLFFRDGIRAFREVVETWGEEYEIYLPKLDNLIKNIGKIAKKSYIPNEKGCGFNVLNHGDLHLRNIIVKANADRRIEHFYFIDHQTSVWCSPVVDLTYVMGLFQNDEKIDELKKEVIVLYHQELVSALKSIGYIKQPPSLLDVNVELLKHGALNVALWINFFPFLYIDWSTMTVDDMMGQDSEKSREFRKGLYETPILKILIRQEMKNWMYNGWW